MVSSGAAPGIGLVKDEADGDNRSAMAVPFCNSRSRSRCWPVVLLGLAGCASASAVQVSQKPDWVDHPAAQLRFPQDRFVAATGCIGTQGLSEAELRAKLESAARAVVAMQVAGQVRATLLDEERLRSKGGSAVEADRVLHQRIDQTVRDFDLSSVTIEDRWNDPRTACALAVLDRAKATQIELPRIAELAGSAMDHVSKGDLLASTDPGSALREYLRAALDEEEAVRSRSLVRAVGGQVGDAGSETHVTASLTTAIGRLAVKVTSGGEQRVRDGKALPHPITLQATVGGVPAAGLPIRIGVDGGRAPALVSTDPQGLALVRVDSVGAFNAPEKVVSAWVDWQALSGEPAPTAWLASLRRVEAQTTIKRRTRESVRVVIRLDEQIMRSADGTDPISVSEPPVRAAIVKALGQAGIHPKDLQDISTGRVVGAVDDDALKRQLSGVADYVIVGSATSRESGKYGTKTVWHRARAALRVVDLGTEQVVGAVNLEAKGREPDFPEKAGRIALETLSEKVGSAIAAEVVRAIDR